MTSKKAKPAKKAAKPTKARASGATRAGVKKSLGDAKLKPAQKPQLKPDTAAESDLLLPSGRVDRSAIYRAAQAEAQRRREMLAQDPDLVTDSAAPSTFIPSGSIVPANASVIDDEESADDAEVSDTLIAPQPQRVVFRLTRDLDKRLDKYLTDRISFMSRSKLQALIESGGVKVNDKPAKPSTNLRVGDTVEVYIEPPPAEDVPPEDIPLDVLYEDQHLIVLNKSPDIIVHPARSHLKGTMINALAYHFRHRSETGGDLSGVGKEFARPGVVHRLDRQTSGVIVFAKTDQAHWQLAGQFQRREVDKRYIAMVHGIVEPLIDTIDLPLGPHPSREKGHREKQVVRHDHLGKAAVTIYRVLGQYGGTALQSRDTSLTSTAPPPPIASSGWAPAHPAAAKQSHAAIRGSGSPRSRASTNKATGPVSLVEVELKTGRTHQIRVHMQSRGHSLLADDLYGGKPASAGDITVNRVALHAALLTFRHPITSKPMIFTAHFPPDLRTFLSAVRTHTPAKLTHEPTEVPGARMAIADVLK